MSVRDEVLSYLTNLRLRNFKVASELPFQPNNTPLYLKNPKTIYVDAEQVTVEPFIRMFNKTIDQEITTVTVFLATDAKQLPQDYNSTVSQIKASKEVIVGKYFVRETETSTEFDTDLLITSINIRLSRIIT